MDRLTDAETELQIEFLVFGLQCGSALVSFNYPHFQDDMAKQFLMNGTVYPSLADVFFISLADFLENFFVLHNKRL